MDALHEAKQEMKRAEGIGEDYPTMLNSSLALVQAYAAIAQAEQLKRIGDLLECYIGPAAPVDPREPGQSWDEYHQQQADALEPVGPSPLDNF